MSRFIKKHWLATGISLGLTAGAFTLVGATLFPLLAPPVLAAPAPPPPPMMLPLSVVRAATAPRLASQLSGIASWYGMVLSGHKTASGERFAPSEMTAAHRNLPFGTLVKVEDVHTGKSVVVRINDRGVLSADRVIDLSASAARELGILKSGLAKVKLEVLGKSKVNPPAAVSIDPKPVCSDESCPEDTDATK